MGALLVRFAQEEFTVYCIDSKGDPYQVRRDRGVLPFRVCCKVERWRRTGWGCVWNFISWSVVLSIFGSIGPRARRTPLAPLADNGLQMPIFVVAAGRADRHLAID